MSWKTVTLDSELYTYEYFLSECVCRLCWCQNGEKDIISNTSEDVETKESIVESIFKFIGVNLAVNTQLTKICTNCWNEVVNFSEFRNFCQETQRKLYDILQNGPQLTEAEDKDDSIQDYGDTNIFSDSELTITNLFEELNDVDEPLPAKNKKKRKLRPATYCMPCKTDLGSQELFKKHSKDIHGLENDLYKCYGCERLFKHRKRCLRHETEYCKNLKNGYKCKKCEKFLPKRSSYEHHLRAHLENRDLDITDELFKCKRCVKEFISMEALKEHMLMHNDDSKNWVCDTCGRVFTRRDYLHKHKLMHEGRKLHVCPHCDFRTIQKSSLNVHIRKHTGERPYPCSFCPQRCVNSSNLREHMKRHLGIKQFQCKFCDKKYGYKLSLQEHISSVHERCTDNYSCSECGATYSRSRSLRHHLLAKHGKQLKRKDTENENKMN